MAPDTIPWHCDRYSKTETFKDARDFDAFDYVLTEAPDHESKKVRLFIMRCQFWIRTSTLQFMKYFFVSHWDIYGYINGYKYIKIYIYIAIRYKTIATYDVMKDHTKESKRYHGQASSFICAYDARVQFSVFAVVWIDFQFMYIYVSP